MNTLTSMPKCRLQPAAVGFTLSLFASALWAQSTLEPVTVTAQRVEQPITQTVSSVTVLSREDIERGNYTSVAEVLRQVPGISINQQGGRGQTQSLILRGTPRSRHTLVLVDGVRLADSTAGQSSLEHLSVDQIERIEVVRGPRSALYGSDAMGGIVQIFTRGSDDPQTSVTAGVGSFGYYQAGIRTSSWVDDWTRLDANLSLEQEDGFDVQPQAGDDDDDGYRQVTGGLALTRYIDNDWSLQGAWSTQQGNTEFDNAFGSGDTTDYLYHRYQAGAEYDGELWGMQLTGAYSSNQQFTYGQGTDRADADAFVTEQYEVNWLQSRALTSDLELIFGTDLRREDVSASTTAYDVEQRDTLGAFAGANWAGRSAMADASARLHSDDQFGEAVTYSLGYRQFLTDSLSASVGLGTAYAVPTFNELYFPGFANPDLEPERSMTAESGVQWDTERFQSGISVFRTWYEDRIVSDPVTFLPDNAGEATVDGIELSAALQQPNGFRADTSLDYFFTEGDDGEPLRGVPEYLLRLNVEQSIARARVGSAVRVEGERADPNADDGTLNAFATFDLHGGYEVLSGLNLGARINNVLDADYQTTAGYASAGRNFLLTLRYQNR